MAVPLIAGALAAARAGLTVAKEPMIRSGLITGAIGVPFANYMGDWAPSWAAQPEMSTGPLSRNSRANAPRRQYDGRTNEYFMTIPGTNVRRVWSAEPTTEVAQAALHEPGWDKEATLDNTPSHLIPGFSRMVNEGYDSWSPSDADNYYEALANDIIDENNASRDRHREGMASGAYKAWSNQIGRGLIDGRMIGEDMNTHGRIHPVLKADWDSEMAGTREGPDFQPWKADNRSEWQKWKDSVNSGRR